jgi:uncharacterized membrane protein
VTGGQEMLKNILQRKIYHKETQRNTEVRKGKMEVLEVCVTGKSEVFNFEIKKYHKETQRNTEVRKGKMEVLKACVTGKSGVLLMRKKISQRNTEEHRGSQR